MVAAPLSPVRLLVNIEGRLFCNAVVISVPFIAAVAPTFATVDAALTAAPILPGSMLSTRPPAYAPRPDDTKFLVMASATSLPLAPAAIPVATAPETILPTSATLTPISLAMLLSVSMPAMTSPPPTILAAMSIEFADIPPIAAPVSTPPAVMSLPDATEVSTFIPAPTIAPPRVAAPVAPAPNIALPIAVAAPPVATIAPIWSTPIMLSLKKLALLFARLTY